MQAGSRRLVELPEPRLPREKTEWAECLRHLDKATQFYQHGEYEQAFIKCRAIVEGIPYVMCDVWGLPPKGNRKFGQWIEAIKNQLSAQWPEDTHTPKMIYTMLTGAWDWVAAAPHYGIRVPMREDVVFVLGLCTDLLHFIGQLLQAHPHPFTSAS